MATARLAVSATPGLVFSDTQFVPSQWQATMAIVAPRPSFAHTEAQVPTDGHPGAFRQMSVLVPPESGSAHVSHLWLASHYDPATQGAIRVIDYAADCIQLDTSEFAYVESAAFFEQRGRRYFSNDALGQCGRAGWTRGALNSLRDVDFFIFDGPPCDVGESCPDFSASGAALRFGYLRRSYGASGESVVHGIDNWSVTVWRR